MRTRTCTVFPGSGYTSHIYNSSMFTKNVRGYRMTSYLEVIPLLQYADDIMFSLEGLVKKAWNLCSFQDLFADIWVF